MERELSPELVDLLEQLAALPLVDRIELAALSGRSPATVYRGLETLSERGLVEALPHAAEQCPHAPVPAHGRRPGASRLGAGHKRRGVATGPAGLRAVAPQSPAPAGRVAAVYRLASGLAEVSFLQRLRWYRAAPADAAIALPDGRTLAILRGGRTVERSAAAQRMRRWAGGRATRPALVLAPDETRLRQLRGTRAGCRSAASSRWERHALSAAADDAVWVPRAGGPALNLEEALGYIRGPGEWTREPPPVRRSMPSPLSAAEDRDPLLSSLLGTA